MKDSVFKSELHNRREKSKVLVSLWKYLFSPFSFFLTRAGFEGFRDLNAWVCWTQWETPGCKFLHRAVTLKTKSHTTCWFLYWETGNYVTRNHKQSACEMRRQRRDKFNHVYRHFETCNRTARTGEEIFSYKAAECQVQPQDKQADGIVSHSSGITEQRGSVPGGLQWRLWSFNNFIYRKWSQVIN